MRAYPLIDTADFARARQQLAFEAALADLERLADLIVEPAGALAARFEGGMTSRGEPCIACIIQGLIKLQCQRCLQPFEHELAIRSQLVFVADESRLPAVEDEQPGIDYVVLEKALDLRALIEDEVILALPLAPVHPPEACGRAADDTGGPPRASAFAALAQLKKLDLKKT